MTPRRTSSLYSAHLEVPRDGRAAPAGGTCPADVLRGALLVLGEVVGAGLVRDAVLEDPGVGGCRVPSLAPVGVVSLRRGGVVKHVSIM